MARRVSRHTAAGARFVDLNTDTNPVTRRGRERACRFVSRLVIAGMTNREIARELMVSVKTVEVQLTSVYAKLEVASRTELRARARTGALDMVGV